MIEKIGPEGIVDFRALGFDSEVEYKQYLAIMESINSKKVPVGIAS